MDSANGNGIEHPGNCPGAEAAFISGAWTAEAIVPGMLRAARAG